jgi:Fe2+ transport system protein FeoA
MRKKLSLVRRGERASVVRVGGSGPAHRRIVEMGLVPGTPVEVVRVAPLGDPIEVRVRGFSLSLRKHEAAEVEVDVESGEGS